MILGTAGYMSPEQARGKEVDKRADIWAFGVVLYEMVTGKRLFEGETVSDTLAAVLMREADLTLAPEKMRRLLPRCLEKDPKKRLRDIGDAMAWLDTEPATALSAAARAPSPLALDVLAQSQAASFFTVTVRYDRLDHRSSVDEEAGASLGAYRIPLETGLLIPSVRSGFRKLFTVLYISGAEHWSCSVDHFPSEITYQSGSTETGSERTLL